MSTELKPCPFCGGKARLHEIASTYHVLWRYVMCDNCLTSNDNYSTEEEAIAAWNRRVPDEARESA